MTSPRSESTALVSDDDDDDTTGYEQKIEKDSGDRDDSDETIQIYYQTGPRSDLRYNLKAAGIAGKYNGLLSSTIGLI